MTLNQLKYVIEISKQNSINEAAKSLFISQPSLTAALKSLEQEVGFDIFIRTNSGGEPLSFSNLLMSITTANWKKRDARQALPDTVKKVFAMGNPNFVISEDFLLKTCLVLFSENIKFQIKNFNKDITLDFDNNWDRVEKSVIAAFKLLEDWGFNDASVRAKNAVIPIMYYIFYNNLENVINKKTTCLDEKKAIRKWLCISLFSTGFR